MVEFMDTFLTQNGLAFFFLQIINIPI
jgi:hypothetical protein